MRKHTWSTVALLLMTLFAFGSVGGNKSSDNAPEPKPAQPGGNNDKPKKNDPPAPNDESESNHNGLVLLTKTVNGTQTDFGLEITGTVVNRRSRAASVTITYNVYDASGGQVGNAIDIVNGLEPGGRWNFKAVSSEKGATKYKLSKLSGF